MKYFDEFLTEDEINQIEKLDYLFTKGIISLDDEKNQKKLACYAYEMYLKKIANENDSKGGDNND